ncbi:hypothetical protein ODQ17_11830 [Acinetobacter sp. IRS14]|nr:MULTISPECIES: hypothetical protein [Acinetobacter]MEA1230056.1 hypothetical protein [Acinetobacter sp. IRS14]WQF73880.1 hypothetical protein OKW95_05005 [Acinetobacter oleivorans]
MPVSEYISLYVFLSIAGQFFSSIQVTETLVRLRP